MSNLDLEVGKYYITQNKIVVLIMERCAQFQDIVFVGSNNSWYTSHGIQHHAPYALFDHLTHEVNVTIVEPKCAHTSTYTTWSDGVMVEICSDCSTLVTTYD